ncbi:hypothetical protein D9V86_07870 [Bacteroidetes/Chlorobi group bacterium ChocPot_Mid]|jgi:glucan phosphoethanolaminetransferase (alkaline phosphatase superfamily)|nr:MAG: hypothetical protein D9V86_07870 [Bacteroidetes/Chlorobi group bacterium ChocPot_Mid]
MLNKLTDLLMFRQPTDEDNQSTEPVVTTGSILWGVLLRSAILILIISLLLESLSMRQHWWLMLFALWFLVAYPAWLQYKKFQERIQNFQEETLCGSCKHFEANSQLCKIYDQHVSTEYIPCEGLSWEPLNEFPED